MTAWLVALLVPFAVAAVAISLLRRTPWTARLADHPNERSLHVSPVRRVGGLGLMAGAMPVALWSATPTLAIACACAIALMAVSLADDLRSLPIAVRLSAHFTAAVVVLLAMGLSPTGAAPFAWLVALGAIAWMTNLFNFMDGTDGLAGGMACIGFAAYAVAAASAGSIPLALASAALASGSVGFLAHNFPPARAFMGDAGSIPLGFLAGALGVLGAHSGDWPILFPVLVFSPFIVDASVTLLRRSMRGEKVWIAHRSHAYQRLVLAGWTRRRLAITAYTLMVAAAGSALVASAQGWMVQCGIIFGWAAIYALLLVAIERRCGKLPAVNAGQKEEQPHSEQP